MGLYKKVETLFERMANKALILFGNSIVFAAALALVIVWFCSHDWKNTRLSETLQDIIIAITFLTFFIIQRTFIHFTQSLHLKVNELVAATENARNHVIKADKKSTEEMKEMAVEHEKIIAALEEEETDNNQPPVEPK
jgi:low affinity Fe/Cu permease